jgi:hypothetical protein
MPWLVQKGSWDIALPILNPEARSGQRHTLPLYPEEWTTLFIAQKDGWSPGPIQMGMEKKYFASIENWSPGSSIPWRFAIFSPFSWSPLYYNVRILKRYFVFRLLNVTKWVTFALNKLTERQSFHCAIILCKTFSYVNIYNFFNFDDKV